MQINTYLLFNGNCEEAFRLYEKLLGGKIESMMPHAGSPAESQVPAEWRDKILHARMTVGDQVLMASDAPPGRQSKPQGFSVSIGLSDPAQAERVTRMTAQARQAGKELGEDLDKSVFWKSLAAGSVTNEVKLLKPSKKKN